MSNDFKRKEPNKTEKVLYELFMQQQHLHQNLVTNSAHIVALSLLLNIEPEKIAELLVNGNDKIKDYSDKINKSIDKLEETKKMAKPQAEKTQ
ncbi:MAG: hypothetical protein KGJ93_00665 [Patescibacteria group bacterium]|nr:hypothetical protein [Patescibacteria group bacterium]